MTHDTDLERRCPLLGGGAIVAAAASPAAADPAPPTATLRIQRLAWAGIRIEVGDTAVFVDATHTGAEDGGPDAPIATEQPRRFALATHHHLDHCNVEHLRPAPGETGTVVVHRDVAPLIDTRPFKLRAVALHEPVFLPAFGDVIATAVPAVDGFGHPQVSWVIRAGGKRIIHCGDTLYHGAWFDIAAEHGPLDVAFTPINGARFLIGKYAHAELPMVLNAEQAAAAAALLDAKRVVPMHYGATPDDVYVEQPDAEARFLKACSERGLHGTVMKVGEVLQI